MPRRKEPRIPDGLLDQLLAGADAKTGFDPNSLLDELKKALAERALLGPGGGTVSRHRPGLAAPVGADRADFPIAVRKIIYTTNAIESLHSRLRKAVRVRGHFPSDEAASKLLFLVLREVSQNWQMAPREWNAARAQFAVMFGDRFARRVRFSIRPSHEIPDSPALRPLRHTTETQFSNAFRFRSGQKGRDPVCARLTRPENPAAGAGPDRTLAERALNAEITIAWTASRLEAGPMPERLRKKTVLTDTGRMGLEVPRDRLSTFDPQSPNIRAGSRASTTGGERAPRRDRPGAIFAGRAPAGPDAVRAVRRQPQRGARGSPAARSRGLVTVLPNRSPFVAILSAAEAAEIYEVRGALEALAGEGFAVRASDEERAELRWIYEELAAMRSALRHEELLALKRRFYDVLLRGSRNGYVTLMFEPLLNRISQLRSTSLSAPRRLSHMVAEVARRVVEPVERRDPRGAAEACRDPVPRAAEIALHICGGRSPRAYGATVMSEPRPLPPKRRLA